MLTHVVLQAIPGVCCCREGGAQDGPPKKGEGYCTELIRNTAGVRVGRERREESGQGGSALHGTPQQQFQSFPLDAVSQSSDGSRTIRSPEKRQSGG